MKLQSLKIFKTAKDVFYKQFDFFLRIDMAEYGASWTLSFTHDDVSYRFNGKTLTSC